MRFLNSPFAQSESDRDSNSDVAKKWVLYPFLATSLSLSLSGNDPSDTHTFQLHPLEQRHYRDRYRAVETGRKG